MVNIIKLVVCLKEDKSVAGRSYIFELRKIYERAMKDISLECQRYNLEQATTAYLQHAF